MSDRGPRVLDPEVVYDLLLDHGDILALLGDEPTTVEDLESTLHEPSTSLAERLGELESAGLVERVEGGFKSVRRVYEIERQEAMLDFLRELVLPAVSRAMVSPGEHALLREVATSLGPRDIEGLDEGPMARFWEELERLDESATQRLPVTLIVAGTGTLPPADLTEPGERAMWCLERASRERAAHRISGLDAGPALVYHVTMAIDPGAWRDLVLAVDRLLRDLADHTDGEPFFMTLAATVGQSPRGLQEVRS